MSIEIHEESEGSELHKTRYLQDQDSVDICGQNNRLNFYEAQEVQSMDYNLFPMSKLFNRLVGDPALTAQSNRNSRQRGHAP